MRTATGRAATPRPGSLLGADVVCLLPTKEPPNQLTAMVAAHLLFELTCLIAERLAARPED